MDAPLVFVLGLAFSAGIPAWAAFAITGNTETARLAAQWGAYLALECFMFVLICFVFINRKLNISSASGTIGVVSAALAAIIYIHWQTRLDEAEFIEWF